MTQKIHIADPRSGVKAEVADGTEQNALVVATRPLKTYENKVVPFLNPTYGINMNIDASAGGTPIPIHNGIDNIYWTASAIVGAVWNFNDATANHTGTYGISGTLLNIGDIAQFAKGSSQDLTNYTSITLWINSVANWDSLDVINFYGWDTGAGAMVGDVVDLGDYINTGVPSFKITFDDELESD